MSGGPSTSRGPSVLLSWVTVGPIPVPSVVNEGMFTVPDDMSVGSTPAPPVVSGRPKAAPFALCVELSTVLC